MTISALEIARFQPALEALQVSYQELHEHGSEKTQSADILKALYTVDNLLWPYPEEKDHLNLVKLALRQIKHRYEKPAGIDDKRFNEIVAAHLQSVDEIYLQGSYLLTHFILFGKLIPKPTFEQAQEKFASSSNKEISPTILLYDSNLSDRKGDGLETHLIAKLVMSNLGLIEPGVNPEDAIKRLPLVSASENFSHGYCLPTKNSVVARFQNPELPGLIVEYRERFDQPKPSLHQHQELFLQFDRTMLTNAFYPQFHRPNSYRILKSYLALLNI